MPEMFVERVGIMADSGISNIQQAFEDTERERIRIEAKHAMEWYSLEERREFLRCVEKHRGIPALEGMKAEMTRLWKEKKNA